MASAVEATPKQCLQDLPVLEDSEAVSAAGTAAGLTEAAEGAVEVSVAAAEADSVAAVTSVVLEVTMVVLGATLVVLGVTLVALGVTEATAPLAGPPQALALTDETGIEASRVGMIREVAGAHMTTEMAATETALETAPVIAAVMEIARAVEPAATWNLSAVEGKVGIAKGTTTDLVMTTTANEDTKAARTKTRERFVDTDLLFVELRWVIKFSSESSYRLPSQGKQMVC